jgi:hypothetical protein
MLSISSILVQSIPRTKKRQSGTHTGTHTGTEERKPGRGTGTHTGTEERTPGRGTGMEEKRLILPPSFFSCRNQLLFAKIHLFLNAKVAEWYTRYLEVVVS